VQLSLSVPLAALLLDVIVKNEGCRWLCTGWRANWKRLRREGFKVDREQVAFVVEYLRNHYMVLDTMCSPYKEDWVALEDWEISSLLEDILTKYNVETKD
jgi:hypothetical protein